jgi:hypothetical protein
MSRLWEIESKQSRSLTFLVYAVKHVVAMVNKVPSETMSEFIARPLLVEDIRSPFLQYVEVHESYMGTEF